MKPLRSKQSMLRLFWHVCSVILPLTLWLCAARAQEPLSWSNRPPYVHVDSGDESVDVPVEAAQAAQRRLKDVPPEHWGIVFGEGTLYVPPPRRIVIPLVEGAPSGVSFLVTPRSWELLSDQNAARLSQVLKQLGRDLVASSFDDQQKLQAYLDALDKLTIGMRVILSDGFASALTNQYFSEQWLKGREKNADALRQLCHDVNITRQGEKVTFTYNLLCYNGNVVRRTVHARVAGRQLKLLRLEAVELQPAGTFSFAISL